MAYGVLIVGILPAPASDVVEASSSAEDRPAVAWTQIANSREICDPRSPGGADCVYVTPTRGAPPGLYLLSAGLTLSSAIVGIIDANKVARRAEAATSSGTAKVRPAPTLSLFPFRLQRGGGLGLAARF